MALCGTDMLQPLRSQYLFRPAFVPILISFLGRPKLSNQEKSDFATKLGHPDKFAGCSEAEMETKKRKFFDAKLNDARKKI